MYIKYIINPSALLLFAAILLVLSISVKGNIISNQLEESHHAEPEENKHSLNAANDTHSKF